MSVPLLCFPYAGAGAGIFRPWEHHPFKEAKVVPIQLPGREERFLDAPVSALDALVDDCVEQVHALVGEGPCAVFGHSFGALVAYETARRLLERGTVRPRHLMVSGAPGPNVPRPRLGLADLSDDDFVTRLSGLIGYEHEALDDSELREIVLPALRCDLAITDGYVPTAGGPLPLRVTALRGADDALVPRHALGGWSDVTSMDFDTVELPGGHMYLAEDWMPLAEEIDRRLADSCGPGH